MPLYCLISPPSLFLATWHYPVLDIYLPCSTSTNYFSAPEGEEEGQKEICSNFDNIIISCVQGICKNVSDVYRDAK